MAFIGIIAKQRNRKAFEKLEKSIYPHQLIYLSETNLENMKNIKFETILIQDAISKEDVLEKMMMNCDYLIVNSDSIDWKLEDAKENFAVITYGYHFKDTVTFSSVTDQDIQICLQRKIPQKKRRNDRATRNSNLSNEK